MNGVGFERRVESCFTIGPPRGPLRDVTSILFGSRTTFSFTTAWMPQRLHFTFRSVVKTQKLSIPSNLKEPNQTTEELVGGFSVRSAIDVHLVFIYLLEPVSASSAGNATTYPN